jgi:hypothetical protein
MPTLRAATFLSGRKSVFSNGERHRSPLDRAKRSTPPRIVATAGLLGGVRRGSKTARLAGREYCSLASQIRDSRAFAGGDLAGTVMFPICLPGK